MSGDVPFPFEHQLARSKTSIAPLLIAPHREGFDVVVVDVAEAVLY